MVVNQFSKVDTTIYGNEIYNTQQQVGNMNKSAPPTKLDRKIMETNSDLHANDMEYSLSDDEEYILKNQDKYTSLKNVNERDLNNPIVIKQIAKIEKVDAEQLRIGIQVEREHTKNLKVACIIALDHLTEEGNEEIYYTDLIESEAKNKANYEDKKIEDKVFKSFGLMDYAEKFADQYSPDELHPKQKEKFLDDVGSALDVGDLRTMNDVHRHISSNIKGYLNKSYEPWNKEIGTLPVGTKIKHEGKTGIVSDDALSDDYSIVKIKGKNYTTHNSDLHVNLNKSNDVGFGPMGSSSRNVESTNKSPHNILGEIDKKAWHKDTSPKVSRAWDDHSENILDHYDTNNWKDAISQGHNPHTSFAYAESLGLYKPNVEKAIGTFASIKKATGWSQGRDLPDNFQLKKNSFKRVWSPSETEQRFKNESGFKKSQLVSYANNLISKSMDILKSEKDPMLTKDKNGNTELHKLASIGNETVLKHPMVDKVKDNWGRTPIQLLKVGSIKPTEYYTKKQLQKGLSGSIAGSGAELIPPSQHSLDYNKQKGFRRV